MSDKSIKPSLPNKKETAVISDKPKTAALFYDRVWVNPILGVDDESYNIPQEIGFYGNSLIEEKMRSARSQYETIFGKYPTWETPPEEARLMKGPQKLKASEISFFYLDYIYKLVHQGALFITIKPIHQRYGLPKNYEMELYHNLKGNGFSPYPLTNLLARQSAKSLSQKYKINISTQFSNSEIQSKLFQEGDKDVIISTIENLKIVDEKNLSWEQVLELRNDEESQKKYKRFINWLDKEMPGKSQAFIEDDIAIKLEDYEIALKKHGIKTIIGTVKEIIDGKFLLGSAAFSGSAYFQSQSPSMALLTQGLLLGCKIAISLAEKKLAYDEIEKGANSEISWVYEVNKKTNNK